MHKHTVRYVHTSCPGIRSQQPLFPPSHTPNVRDTTQGGLSSGKHVLRRHAHKTPDEGDTDLCRNRRPIERTVNVVNVYMIFFVWCLAHLHIWTHAYTIELSTALLVRIGFLTHRLELV